MAKTKVLKFTYTKSSGEVSERKVLDLGPSTRELMLSVDTSNMEEEDISILIHRLEEARRHYLDEVERNVAWFNGQIKTFKYSGMTNISEVKYETKVSG